MTTIRANPAVGERYAVRYCGGWNVCLRTPDNSDGEQTFAVIASGLSEEDARALVYAETVRSELALIRDMAREREQQQIAVHAARLLDLLGQ